MSHGARIGEAEKIEKHDIVGIKDLTNRVGNYAIAEVEAIMPSPDEENRVFRLRTNRSSHKTHPAPYDKVTSVEKTFIRHASSVFIILKHHERDFIPVDPTLAQIQKAERTDESSNHSAETKTEGPGVKDEVEKEENPQGPEPGLRSTGGDGQGS